MATEVLLPKLGFSMNEGTISEWLAADGAQIAAGDPLYSLESDKSVTEVESPATGTLRILASIDETYEVGTVLAVIE